MKYVLSYFLIFSMVLGLMPAATMMSKAATTTYTSGNYTYTLDSDSNATITAYSGTEGSVVVPENLDGHTVKSIGNNAFKNCKTLTTISMPDTVKSIGNDAFAYTGLASLQLPSQLESIGYSIIYGVKGVTEITIPKTVQSMDYYGGNGDGPFAGSNVKEVVFERGISMYLSH